MLGAVFTFEALVALLWPAWFTDWAPWRITPLNARALAGYYILLGLMMLSVARENDLDRARFVAPFFVLVMPIAAIQLHRFTAQVDWGHPRLWIVALLLALTAALGLRLARGDWRRALGRV